MLSPNYYHSRKESLGNRAFFCPKFGDLSPKLGIDKKKPLLSQQNRLFGDVYAGIKTARPL